MKVIVAGGSETGLALANLLAKEHQVTLIETDEERAKELANKTEALVVNADACDMAVLKENGVEEVDALVATADDKTNLMVSEIAKAEGVMRVVVLVNEAKNEELFVKIGINDLVSAVGTSVIGIKRILDGVTSNVRIVAELDEGDLQIVELTVGEGSELVGQSVRLKNARVAAIYVGDDFILPTDETVLEAGNILVVAVKTKDLISVRKLILGE